MQTCCSCEIPDIIFVQEEVGGIDAADGTFQSIRDAPVSAEILGYEDHMKSVMWALGEAVDYLRLPALQDILEIVDDKIDLSFGPDIAYDLCGSAGIAPVEAAEAAELRRCIGVGIFQVLHEPAEAAVGSFLYRCIPEYIAVCAIQGSMDCGSLAVTCRSLDDGQRCPPEIIEFF